MAKESAIEIAIKKGDARAMAKDEVYNEAPGNSMEPELATLNLRYDGCYYNDRKTLENGKVDGANLNARFTVMSGKTKGAKFHVKAYFLKSNNEKDDYTTKFIQQLCRALDGKSDALDDKSLLGKVINARVAYDIDVKTRKPKILVQKLDNNTERVVHLFKVFDVRQAVTVVQSVSGVAEEIAN